VGAGGEMNQALYAHMNNKRKMKKKIIKLDKINRKKKGRVSLEGVHGVERNCTCIRTVVRLHIKIILTHDQGQPVQETSC
jgi:hypothetical protein